MSVVALLGLLVSVATVVIAAAYAVRPSERLLLLMRPLSIAATFGGLSTFTLGATMVLKGAAAGAPAPWRAITVGAAESIAGLFAAFGCLTIAWLLVTLGLRRTP